MLHKMGKRRWYKIGMVLGSVELTHHLRRHAHHCDSCRAMVIVAKIMPTLMLGIGPFFIAMLMFPVTAKWFDSWFGRVTTTSCRLPW